MFVPVLAIGLLGYFGYHALNGELGIVGKALIERQVRELETQLSELSEDRIVLERRVMLLMPHNLHPDMVDERARAALNLVHSDEVAIFRR
ncbi:FtsB family cell division protein [Flexibacterium corallicola]|uniref:FtsB family cell division protein n=1 Tax=Flexibacterium corallicola TaxID=3037259 RepID=UPI00286EE2D8|nr:septum formation initiator family protein [Pseudovibrio sp. M1P-2-3]